jgi:multiple sugar transport system permease protein
MSGTITAHSVVDPSPLTRRIAGALIILYAIVTMVPLAWIVLTSFK